MTENETITPTQWAEQQAAYEAERHAAYVIKDVPERFARRIRLPDVVAGWADSPRAKGLYLTGGIGTGKTHTAWEVVMRLREGIGIPGPAYKADWMGNREFLARELEAWRTTTLLDCLRPGAEGHRATITTCQSAGLLLLDDLGAEKPSEWTQERLYEVIDERYIHRRPLIITSNVPPAKLADVVGDRTASRLAEMCLVVPLTGTDRRKS